MSTQFNNKRVLGKGLSAIIASSPQPVEEIEKVIVDDKDRIIEIELSQISPNPDQPRLFFDETEIEGLSESIKAVGLIQPIIVRKDNDRFFIVAGERRFRATKLAGFTKIRAIVVSASEEENFSMALIENVQRQNLDPIEESKAYRMLINRFKLKQNDVAQRVGKGRESIANSLRLLNLPDQMQEALSAGKLSVGHAKVLLSIESPDDQMAYFDQIQERGLSVRALESIISEEKSTSSGAKKNGKNGKSLSAKEAHIRKMEDKLRQLMGTKVEIRHSGTKGRIEISYYSLEDFERIIEKFI
ncbi:MAG TPA: ParB/RepB/Spo0J family partition protein [Spirochaetota bacterium]